MECFSFQISEYLIQKRQNHGDWKLASKVKPILQNTHDIQIQCSKTDEGDNRAGSLNENFQPGNWRQVGISTNMYKNIEMMKPQNVYI